MINGAWYTHDGKTVIIPSDYKIVETGNKFFVLQSKPKNKTKWLWVLPSTHSHAILVVFCVEVALEEKWKQESMTRHGLLENLKEKISHVFDVDATDFVDTNLKSSGHFWEVVEAMERKDASQALQALAKLGVYYDPSYLRVPEKATSNRSGRRSRNQDIDDVFFKMLAISKEGAVERDIRRFKKMMVVQKSKNDAKFEG